MNTNTNDKIIAYLTLVTGLALSVVAEFYSIAGLTAIFSAAVIPVIIMGVALGLGKIVATIWVKQNWNTALWNIKIYLCAAIAVLMLITSMGIFGFLSKAHSDASLVSGEVQAKIAVYDEKIKTAKDNIDANRKALKQMDEAVDQVMARSSSETGADKAVGLRRSQLKERARLQSEIQAEQKTISRLSEERAPIAAEVRKVEAEVGPIKYIAQFVYSDTSEDILGRAVTWVILLIIFVFDPLALMLLLASQISFQKIRERDQDDSLLHKTVPHHEIPVYVSEPPAVTALQETTEGDSPEKESDVVSTATVTINNITEGDSPQGPVDVVNGQTTVTNFVAQEIAEVLPEAVATIKEETVPVDVDRVNNLIADVIEELKEQRLKDDLVQLAKGEFIQDDASKSGVTMRPIEDVEYTNSFKKPEGYVQNEEQAESNLWAKTMGK